MGTNVLRNHVCGSCACPTALFYATCGTVGSSYPLVQAAPATTQVVCPLDCLSRVMKDVVDTGVPPLVGSNGKYSTTTPVCLAAMHSGIITYNQHSLPAATFSPQPVASIIAAVCLNSPTSLLPLYSDPSLFPASNRPNGRPHILYQRLTGAQTFTAATTRCITSGGATGTNGFRISILNSQYATISTVSVVFGAFMSILLTLFVAVVVVVVIVLSACSLATMCDPTQCGGPSHGYCNQNTGICQCNPPYFGSNCAQSQNGDDTVRVQGETGKFASNSCPNLIVSFLLLSEYCPYQCYNGNCNYATGKCDCSSTAYYGDQCILRPSHEQR